MLTGREAGFSVYYSLDLAQRWLSPVQFGDTESIIYDDKWKYQNGGFDTRRVDIDCLFTLHSHPSNSIAPSEEDLGGLDLCPVPTGSPEQRPVLGIVSIGEHNRGEMLLIRRTAPIVDYSDSDLRQAYLRTEDRAWISPEELAEIYTVPNSIRATTLPYSIPRNRPNAVLSREENKRLDAFASND